jgi:hypothetical protein
VKEGRSSDSVEYISDESGDDVEEHGDQDKLSNFNEPESNHSGESPVFWIYHGRRNANFPSGIVHVFFPTHTQNSIFNF